MRAVRHLAALLALAALTATCFAQDLPLQPYSYHQGFEGDVPELTLWASNGPSTVNYMGPSEERAFEGKKSLKVDITLGGGSYHYYGVQLRVPCEGKLTMSARLYVADGTTARVGFGTNMNYPPTRHSGCGSIEALDKPNNDWKLIETDLVARGMNGKKAVISQHAPTAKGEDCGAYLDRWSLFIYGGEGTRVIVYLDDVRVEGEIPTEEDYDAAINRRWATGQEEFKTRIANWRAQLADAEQALAAMGETPAGLQDRVQAVTDSVGKARKLIDTVEKTGYGGQGELESITAAIATVQYGPETIKAIADATDSKAPFLIYTPNAITDDRLTSVTFPIPAPVGKELSCSGCRDEYESVTAALYALEDQEQLMVSCSDLKGPAGVIPANALDIYAVKSWYQAGRSISDKTHKMLVPELLLKDSGLVRVDLEEEQNYLRSTAEDGTEEYLLCSAKESENLAGVRPIDTADLQPVDLAANSLQQYWFTVHIPQDAAAGLYEGAVTFATAQGKQSMPLRVTVHPFELPQSRLTYSIYYRGKLARDGKPTISSEGKADEQYYAEMADMQAHGVLHPTNYQGWDEEFLPRVLEIRQDLGMPTDAFYNLGLGTGNTDDPAKLAELQAGVRKWIDLCAQYGYEDIYFYGMDEATGDRLASQRATWKAVQDAGGKTFVACYYKTFEAMGALLNCAVLAGKPDPDECAKWHGVGSHAFMYAYPQVGEEVPETYRRNFGLVLWKAGFDGAMDYAYQHGFGHVWNDFDSTSYRDHNFTYPTVDGVVGTIQWEGFREAVDDVRYVTALENAITSAPATRADIAKQAQAWLDGIDPAAADLYELRARMADWIQKLR